MSRNLANGNVCDFCNEAQVVIVGPAALITEEQAGAYFAEYDVLDLKVADAECKLCLAKYLAWVSWSKSAAVEPLFDLSFRSTFNDAPGDADLPTYRIERIVTFKKTPWSKQ